jgi:hypothetical protein
MKRKRPITPKLKKTDTIRKPTKIKGLKIQKEPELGAIVPLVKPVVETPPEETTEEAVEEAVVEKPSKEFLASSLQKRVSELYMHHSRRNTVNAPIGSDFHLKSLLLHYLNGRIFRAHKRILFRDDVNQYWVNEKADVLACLEIYIEGQDFKKKTPKGSVIDYFRSLGEIKAFANSLYNYREIPENDDIDHYILRHTRGKINYLNGMTYYMKYDQFRRTTVQDYYYLNTKKEIPTKNKGKMSELFGEIKKVFGDHTELFLAHFSRIMSGEGNVDKLLTCVTGPRHSSKGTVLSMFQLAFGGYVSQGPMNFFLCHQHDKMSDPDSLNKYLASVSGISTARLCYSTEMASRDENHPDRIHNPIVLNGTYSRSLNACGDQIPIRKLYVDTIMAIQVACIVLQSNAIYPTNPSIAGDTVVFIKTKGRFLTPFEYENLKAKGAKDIYIRDPKFRENLITNQLADQLPFLLAEFYNTMPIKFPINFFFRGERKDTTVVFMDVLRKYITYQPGEYTPAWLIRSIIARFKDYLPRGTTNTGLLRILYPDIHFVSKKRGALNQDGIRETLSCRLELKLDPALNEINPLEEIHAIGDQQEEENDLRNASENISTKIDCTNPDRIVTPYARIRTIPTFQKSPPEICQGTKKNLFG